MNIKYGQNFEIDRLIYKEYHHYKSTTRANISKSRIRKQNRYHYKND